MTSAHITVLVLVLLIVTGCAGPQSDKHHPSLAGRIKDELDKVSSEDLRVLHVGLLLHEKRRVELDYAFVDVWVNLAMARRLHHRVQQASFLALQSFGSNQIRARLEFEAFSGEFAGEDVRRISARCPFWAEAYAWTNPLDSPDRTLPTTNADIEGYIRILLIEPPRSWLADFASQALAREIALQPDYQWWSFRPMEMDIGDAKGGLLDRIQQDTRDRLRFALFAHFDSAKAISFHREHLADTNDPFVKLAIIRLTDGEWGDFTAEQLLRYPGDPELLYLAGLASVASKDTRKARQRFEEAVAADPFHSRARLELARLAIAAHDRGKAVQQLGRILVVEPNDSSLIAPTFGLVDTLFK